MFIFYLYTLIILQRNFVAAEEKCDKSEFPAKEQSYDVRPNIFIDKDHLLGQVTKSGNHHKKGFTYGNGPLGISHWARISPKCAGKKQSPINIDIPSLKRITIPKLKWSDLYNKIPERMTMMNNGHTIKLKCNFPNNTSPKIEGGNLARPYLLDSLHFHWSQSDHRGGEHTINKKPYPMEMHVVHYREDLNFSAALKTDKGLAVVGYIFEIGDSCNDALSDILSVADLLRMEEQLPVELPDMFRLSALVETFEKEYVSYAGSLTTPPCTENVAWMISPYTMTISKKQIEKFRSISMAPKSFGDNYRNVQPLNGRIINFVN